MFRRFTIHLMIITIGKTIYTAAIPTAFTEKFKH